MGEVKQVSGVVATDAGSLALWNVDVFAEIVDYDTWEPELLEDEDRARHVGAGNLVPIDIGCDGAFQVLVRVDLDAIPALTAREAGYLVVSSDRYLTTSPGRLVLSGIEHVGVPPWTGLVVRVPAGRWEATVHMIEWDAEPGSKDESARPVAGALPDFVVLIGPPTAAGGPWRQSVRTFDD